MLRSRPLFSLLTGSALLVGQLPAHASTDPFLGRQWNLQKVGAPAAWPLTTGEGVRIGIVDSGIDLQHEDLAGQVVAHTSCVGSAGDPSRCTGTAQDDQGHGTHVAGIAAASKDNGKGIAGVAPDADLVVAKVLDAAGSGSTEDVLAGIKWVVDQGARVVNLSLGDPTAFATALLGSPAALHQGLDYAWAHGAIPVVAAGNSNTLGLGLEGGGNDMVNAVVVASSGPDDSVASYSTPTGQARFAMLAPGGAANGRPADDIYSTVWNRQQPNGYGYLAGTSMAAPHVSGALALLLSQGYAPLDAVERMLQTADRTVDCGSGSPKCPGRLDVAKATARPS